ncbi:hypothetical protein BDQ17DRAFT_1246859 [Cyathus striatus]|nr:hypothetical protein BDQ17DRAFT_1246859 [Cyathus striatus]
MLSFGLKVAWFVLSLTGLMLCWIVMWALSRTVGTVWGPLLYAIGCTMLQGIFCLGMIYKMDPFLMPRAFCIAQTVIIGHSTFLMNGVAGAFAVATSLTVLKPKTWGLSSDVALKWRNIYYIPVVIFPFLATVVHIAFVFVFDSSKPSDNLHCDSSDPEWVRFLGYAGLPFLVSIPCMYLSVKSVFRVYKTNQHIQRARHDDIKADKFTKPKSRAMRMKIFRLSQHSAPSPVPSAHIPGSRHHSLSLCG